MSAWLVILYVDFFMHIADLRGLYWLIGKQGVSGTPVSIPKDICRTIDLGCVLYFKRVLCLQRSAATVLMLRRRGWNAALTVGIRIFPFESHAWVEIENAIVNDRPYLYDKYQVLHRW
jgi:hypothetical protein